MIQVNEADERHTQVSSAGRCYYLSSGGAYLCCLPERTFSSSCPSFSPPVRCKSCFGQERGRASLLASTGESLKSGSPLLPPAGWQPYQHIIVWTFSPPVSKLVWQFLYHILDTGLWPRSVSDDDVQSESILAGNLKKITSSLLIPHLSCMPQVVMRS